MKPFIAALFLSAGFFAQSLHAADQPNILWITSEDNSWNWLGCYGNTVASTPRLDALAAQGMLFTHAYANGPVCAVARSTILNGAYAVTQGTQHMRSRHPIPADFKPYVSYLRGQGYYCTNNSKTDYNFKGNDVALWDACSASAHYRNRPDGKPFFAVFNLLVSHESSLFPQVIASNREKGIIPRSPRIDPATITPPPYLPDLPEIRSDIAIYHDNITALDTQVGRLLDELEQASLARDTIVIYCSDHGGIIPRGKRYLEETGVHVPLLVSIPEKWRQLSPFKPGQRVDELVSFVDLAPTLLSLAGIEKPALMQGRAFLGPRRAAPPENPVVFLYADRFDETYGMRRGITDSRWKYIRCFTPRLPAAPYSDYQFGQAGWTAWRKAWQDGTLAPPFRAIWEPPQPVERLFDLEADPMEIRDLYGDPACAARLASMRDQLKAEMINACDTGIIPEPMFSELAPDAPIAGHLASRKGAVPELVSLAFAASAAEREQLPRFLTGMESKDPVTRYWAVQGCVNLGKSAAAATGALIGLLIDPSPTVRVAACDALCAVGHRGRGIAALLAELDRATGEYLQLYIVNVLARHDALGDISEEWVKRTLRKGKPAQYLKDFANRAEQARHRSPNP